MRKLLIVVPLVLPLQACFFVWIPGNVVGAVADKITGDEGEHCVSRAAKVGDMMLRDGKAWEVKSLSGTSMRCTNPDLPIRAKMAPL